MASGEPPLPPGVSYVDIVGGNRQFAARRSDGTVVAWEPYPQYFDLQMPPLAAGTTYNSLAAGYNQVVGLVGPTSTYVSFAGGCSGSGVIPRLLPRDTPRIGSRLTVLLGPLPIDVALMVSSWQRLAQPVDLAALGMPACFLHTQTDAWTLVGGGGGQARYELAIPNAMALVGWQFQHQALVPDPMAGNALGAVVSDAAEATIGR